MTLFRSELHQDIWIEHHCHQCWRNDGCTIRTKALESNRKPVEWERNTRKNSLMQDTIKCSEQAKLPPVQSRGLHSTRADVPLFDVAAPIDMDPDHA